MSKPAETSHFFKLTLPGFLLLALLVALLVSIASQNFVRGGPGKITFITNNLRQLDAAVQLWAMDHHPTGDVLVTRQDIAPYLKAYPELHGWVKQIRGEQYILKPITESPEAVLTCEVDGRPKGTVIRLATNGDIIFILPKPQDGLPHRAAQ
jgi:hypothetical protein